MVPPLLDTISDSAKPALLAYLKTLGQWAPRINLTAAANETAAIETLILPVLGSEGLLRGTVLDVGSGNGSPGLVLAALRPDLSFVLLEPRAKRWAFLRQAIRDMGLSNVSVVRGRTDSYDGPPVDTVTMRAVGLNVGDLAPLLLPGGVALVFGGPDIPGTESIELPYGSVRRRCFT